MKMRWKILVLLATAMTLSCNYQVDKNAENNNGSGAGGSNKAGGGGGGGAEGVPQITSIEGDVVTLTYEGGETETIQSNEIAYDLVGPVVIDAYCLKCHEGASAPKGSDFSSYNKSTQWAPRILARMSDGSMPPAPPMPSEAEIQAIELWIANGTPETKP